MVAQLGARRVDGQHVDAGQQQVEPARHGTGRMQRRGGVGHRGKLFPDATTH
jgi:hypothetical protein